MRTQPNFLFIVTDQQRADHLGCAGNALLRTPNLDALAKSGSRFRRFHAASPICMPNRASIMTGRMPSLHGVRDNGTPLSLESTTFVELLRAAGWRTALIGKSHLQNYLGLPPLRPTSVPKGSLPPPVGLAEAQHAQRSGNAYDMETTRRWREEPGHEVATPFYGFDYVRICTRHGDQVQGHYTRWLLAQRPDGDALRDPNNPIPDPRYVAPQSRRTRLPEALYPTTYISEESIAYLERHAAGSAGAPFFLQCSFTDPHHPFTPPGRYWDMYNPDDVVLPPSFHASHNQIPPIAQIHHELTHGTPDRTFQRPYAVTEREARESIALTYGMVTMIDDAVGRVLARLEALGLAANTVVVFTSDHGDWLGDHGLMLKGPIHTSGVVRVPFIWRDPAGPTAAVCDTLASSIDIAPTVLARAGLAPFNGVQGCDLRPCMAGATLARDSVLIEQESDVGYLGYDPGVPGPLRVRSLISGQWRLSLWSGFAWGELYDLVADPHEMHNLWDAPGSAALRAQLMERMTRALIDNQDWSPHPTGVA